MTRNVLEVVTPTQFIGEQNGHIEGPCRDGDILSRKPGGKSVVDVEDEQDLKSREPMQYEQEQDREKVVEGNSLLESLHPAAFLIGSREDAVPSFAQQRME